MAPAVYLFAPGDRYVTRRQLQRARGRAECARFFDGLRGEITTAQIRALPRMKALSQRCGFASRSGRGHRRTHKRRSAMMRGFKTRVAFFSLGPDAGIRAFLARPQWDAVSGSPTGFFEFVDETTGAITLGPPKVVAPVGYIEWRVYVGGGTDTFFIPVTRAARAVAAAILQTRREARRSRTIAPAA